MPCAHMEVRRQLASVGSLRLPWSFQRLDRGRQAWQQGPLPAKPLALIFLKMQII